MHSKVIATILATACMVLHWTFSVVCTCTMYVQGMPFWLVVVFRWWCCTLSLCCMIVLSAGELQGRDARHLKRRPISTPLHRPQGSTCTCMNVIIIINFYCQLWSFLLLLQKRAAARNTYNMYQSWVEDHCPEVYTYTLLMQVNW